MVGLVRCLICWRSEYSPPQLFDHRRNTHFQKTRNMLRRLIAQSIQTGTVTTVVMVAMFVTYETADSKSQAYIAWCVGLHSSFIE